MFCDWEQLKDRENRFDAAYYKIYNFHDFNFFLVVLCLTNTGERCRRVVYGSGSRHIIVTIEKKIEIKFKPDDITLSMILNCGRF